jgi:predicted phosphoribosyltransferase
MHVKNRDDAARQLADRLVAYEGQNPLELGVERGAVPMARIIADAREGELDVVLVRKLRASGQHELAIGAADEAGSVLKAGIVTSPTRHTCVKRSAPSRTSFARAGSCIRVRRGPSILID